MNGKKDLSRVVELRAGLRSIVSVRAAPDLKGIRSGYPPTELRAEMDGRKCKHSSLIEVPTKAGSHPEPTPALMIQRSSTGIVR
jgi:hypothetical protein